MSMTGMSLHDLAKAYVCEVNGDNGVRDGDSNDDDGDDDDEGDDGDNDVDGDSNDDGDSNNDTHEHDWNKLARLS
jgi:hypothetical protein